MLWMSTTSNTNENKKETTILCVLFFSNTILSCLLGSLLLSYSLTSKQYPMLNIATVLFVAIAIVIYASKSKLPKQDHWFCNMLILVALSCAAVIQLTS